VRLRYVIAVLAASAWIVAFGQTIDDPSSLLQFVWAFVAFLIFAAIAWPDDFRSSPRTKDDGSPKV
jgi:hypothetical protein